MDRCGTCNSCEIERIGCACDGAYDNGCFHCTPEQHQRPACPTGSPAIQWIKNYCKENLIDWSKLTKGEQFKITMTVPCTIRCFRVGGVVDVTPGQPCPECGKEAPIPTLWERISEEAELV